MRKRKGECLATLQPQAWIRDWATDIDGAFKFDVAPIVERLGEAEALAITDNSEEAEALYEEWLDAHPDLDGRWGPYTVYCASAIAAYFGKPDPNDWRILRRDPKTGKGV